MITWKQMIEEIEKRKKKDFIVFKVLVGIFI